MAIILNDSVRLISEIYTIENQIVSLKFKKLILRNYSILLIQLLTGYTLSKKRKKSLFTLSLSF